MVDGKKKEAGPITIALPDIGKDRQNGSTRKHDRDDRLAINTFLALPVLHFVLAMSKWITLKLDLRAV